ncbi:MAG: glucose-6-phosphate isomerase, partial [Chthoniobacterales bacterium]
MPDLWSFDGSMSQLSLTQTPAWKALAAHHREMAGLHLRELFAGDPKRGEKFAAEACGLYLDYSKNRATEQTFGLLVGLAQVRGFRGRIDAIFRGDRINTTENRAV